ncbi:MAG: YceD family protein [Actinomycetia bacterium]|nr:YceD family protein [Actinomycetes bacterium]
MSVRRPVDARSGLVLEVHDLSRQPGTMRQLRRTVEAPEGVGLEIIEVPAGSPVELDVRLEAVGEGVLVSGTAAARLAGECTRCLTQIATTSQVDIQELFYYPGNGPDGDDVSRIEEERINLEPVVRDAVVLDLPFAPLCRDDCLGLCQRCGANLNEDPDHQHTDLVDPRWDGLSGWTPQS